MTPYGNDHRYSLTQLLLCHRRIRGGQHEQQQVLPQPFEQATSSFPSSFQEDPPCSGQERSPQPGIKLMPNNAVSRRRSQMVQFLNNLSDASKQMTQELSEAAISVKDNDEDADSDFANGLSVIENFIRNVNFRQAAVLMARYVFAVSSKE